MLRESKRNNPVFRQYALEYLADFVELRKEVDMFPQTRTLVLPIIEESLDNSEQMDIDSKSSGAPSSKSVTETTLANATTALLQSINPVNLSNDELSSRLSHSLDLILRIRKENRSRKVIEAIFDAQKHLFEKISSSCRKEPPALSTSSLKTVLAHYTTQLFPFTDLVEQSRIKAADAVVALAGVIARKGGGGGGGGGDEVRTVFLQKVMVEKEGERSVSVLQALERARKVVLD